MNVALRAVHALLGVLAWSTVAVVVYLFRRLRRPGGPGGGGRPGEGEGSGFLPGKGVGS
jgi:hypothetical protein